MNYLQNIMLTSIILLMGVSQAQAQTQTQTQTTVTNHCPNIAEVQVNSAKYSDMCAGWYHQRIAPEQRFTFQDTLGNCKYNYIINEIPKSSCNNVSGVNELILVWNKSENFCQCKFMPR